jgi:hypothetical protein
MGEHEHIGTTANGDWAIDTETTTTKASGEGEHGTQR